MKPLRSWQLPPGVHRATWDYLQSERIATEYDSYFDGSGLMQLDIEFLRAHLPPPAHEPIVADLGCGTARVAKQLQPLGYRTLNIDLSLSMLKEAQSVAVEEPSSQAFLRTNLAELECLRSASLDAAVCLFSSLGMVHGHAARLKMLTEVRRSLREDAPFIVHVHNRYQSVRDPGGLKWLIQSFLRSRFDRKVDFGDRLYSYRGLPSMFLHIFSRHEIVRILRSAGFGSVECFPLNPTSDGYLPRRVLSDLRAGGFLILAR